MFASHQRRRRSRDANSLCAKSARTLQRMYAIALAGFCVVLALLSVEAHFAREAANQVAIDRERMARVIERLRQERLMQTTAVNLAAATGDRQWVARFNAEVAKSARAFDFARALVGPASVVELERASAAHEALEAMDRKAIASVMRNDLSAAREILASGAHVGEERALGRAIDGLERRLDAETTRRLNDIALMSVVLRLALALVGVAAVTIIVRPLVVRSHRMIDIVETNLRRLAQQDPLTGLANRSAFEAALSHALAGDDEAALPFARALVPCLPQRLAREDGASPADELRPTLLAIDLNDFKTINDTHGHACGDGVLTAVGHRLRRLYPDALVARTGGDEFSVLTRDPDPTLKALMERTRAALHDIAEPVRSQGLEHRITAAVGVARAKPGWSADDLMTAADTALYEAKTSKRHGNGTIRVFTPTMEEDLKAAIVLKDRLDRALRKNQFRPFFQPIVELGTGQPVGAEALARWEREGGLAMPPGRFMAMLDRMGRVDELTWAMLEQACAAALDWVEPLPVSINVGPTQLAGDFAERALKAIDAVGLPPTRLEVEVLETAFGRASAELTRVVDTLREAGVRIALDDFGVGYSSLGQLSRLSIDKIKIDRSFVAPLKPTSDDDPSPRAGSRELAVVRAAIDLAEAFQLDVCAEGIETSGHAEVLSDLGCRYGQGYYFGRPMNASDFARFLAADSPPVPSGNVISLYRLPPTSRAAS